ncbi:MAG: adenine deaminase [Bacteroidales bacterium]|nr:adenine deaminase [Bacteroidales bacterium]
MNNQKSYTVSGNIVDIVNKEIFQGTITVEGNKIISLKKEQTGSTKYIAPGFIDAHVHIESSMLLPSEFARLAVIHGTVATVSDPHEIANVLGIDGVKFMINNGDKVPFKFYFGAPSCVPATPFETSGASLGPEEVEELLKMNKIKYLSEMMNFPGVLFGDEEVKKKLDVAKKYNKVIDGHAPGLKGDDAKRYIEAGISTDHECFTIEEALDKISYGMKILIREGSAAKNFDALIELLDNHSDQIMFCSDDKHPNDLVDGHINLLVKRAIAMGYDPVKVLRTCIYNPVMHYGLDVGLLQQGDNADFIVLDNLADLNILETYIDGVKVAEDGKSLIPHINESTPNNFKATKISVEEIKIAPTDDSIKVIKAFDGQLITESISVKPMVENGNIVSDIQNDILKLVVMNRYEAAPPAIGFINNFNLKQGAMASTVAHDSHNIIAVGTSDEEIVKAVNLLIETKGGVSVVNGEYNSVLPLAVAGLMSADNGFEVAGKYDMLDKKIKEMGSKLSAPYMTLSFMALLVIPALKLSDKGLFDGNKFEFTAV